MACFKTMILKVRLYGTKTKMIIWDKRKRAHQRISILYVKFSRLSKDRNLIEDISFQSGTCTE
jgi:hypothetical protein